MKIANRKFSDFYLLKIQSSLALLGHHHPLVGVARLCVLPQALARCFELLPVLEDARCADRCFSDQVQEDRLPPVKLPAECPADVSRWGGVPLHAGSGGPIAQTFVIAFSDDRLIL